MKPDTQTAMRNLIAEVRDVMPFEMPVDQMCSGICNGCAKKLLDFLDIQLEEWEWRLDQGEVPALGDLDKLGKTCRKIYRVLEKNGLVGETDTQAA
ncbi:hypothetical protein QKW35_11670 [Pontibacterium granulatum]|uniref:hypothetical protein n=1 Tax=Pontibacterium granulatum TaxID=2036029 RepID=UPI002499BF90|nr:hypothetical protein [Pontibacterium granulatum]MDI3325038.1 hypothetical protein [Pontibacterium granulatum]